MGNTGKKVRRVEVGRTIKASPTGRKQKPGPGKGGDLGKQQLGKEKKRNGKG